MEIIENGRKLTIEGGSLAQLEEAYRKKHKITRSNLVTIINGFHTTEDRPLQEGDSVTFIEKGKMPEKDVLEAMMLARNTPHVHNKLKAATVGIAGLGGLGSYVALALARAGIGHLHLVDFDVVEPSNLNRQQYRISQLGAYKTEALAQEIWEVNPYCMVSFATIRVCSENAADLFEGCDIVCEAFDRPEEKAMLVNALLEKNREIKVVSGSGMAGYESSNTINTKRELERLYVCGDQQTEAKEGCGLMAPRVMICAGHQANMILRLLLGEENE